ncbi:YcjX family protein [Alteromonas stellipolaris]|uniref:YcjX family protein n=1 Tax=Alteromonas stellipolaris TaxID=233316 RepID=UPI0027326CB7|nr:YcjX family protein [Alteromonas stellipolaris]MDP2535457.1 YcjX family protein [Alteromonas stellipolaris]
MQNSLSSLLDKVRLAASASGETLSDIFSKETHRFTITGLSRSGKSMLFTSLMTMLKSRSEEGYACMPLLRYLPPSQVEFMRIEPIDGYKPFPLEENMDALASGRWPEATEEAYGFKLVVRLTQTMSIKRHLLPHTDIVFEFIDYPGEWITDIPMLGKTYAQWSDSAWAQLSSGPQQHFANEWKTVVNAFDFEQLPTQENINALVSAYRHYLVVAKKNGISLLQPGSFLLDSSDFDWQQLGFAPLPSSITSDVSHPWYKVFDAHFTRFQKDWLTPLKQSVFRETDKQIILVDLFEGLNHSRQHLYQLKETLSHLADTFVYGQTGWFARNVMRKEAIGRVAFVATKADLIPVSERENLLSLLKQVTEGARARFVDKPIQFEHFLVSAIQVTDEGSSPNALRYQDAENGYVEAAFEPIPASLKAMEADAHFPVLNTQVPQDYMARILSGRGLDRLLQFLLAEGVSNE